jgi:ATP-binding cassette subfamily B protein
MGGLIRYAFQVAPGWSSFTTATAVLAGAAPVGISVASGRLVNALDSAIGRGTSSPAAHESYRWVAVIAGLFFLTHVMDAARTAAGRALGRQVTGRLAERVMAAASAPDTVGHLEDPAYLDRVARASGAGSIEIPPGEAIFGFSSKSTIWVTCAGSAAVLAQLNWILGVALFVLFAEMYRRLARNFRRSMGHSAHQSRELRRASYLRDVPATPEAAKEVRVFGLMPFFRAAFQAEWRTAMEQIWKTRRELNGFALAVPFIVGVAVGGTFSYLGFSVLSGGLTVGSLTTGGLAVRALLVLLTAGSDEIRISFGGGAAAEALGFPVTARPREPLDEWPVPVTGLSCADVSFSYPGSASRALSNVSFSMPAGQSLAIVGLNGAGKTTLARLIAGLDRPTAGCLSAAGVVIDDSSRRRWQRQVAAVFQDFEQYELSLRDNIVFGALAHSDDRAGMREAARMAGVTDLVERLPGGWDTILSSGYPGGADISGGEWQRVALARSLFALRHGARLLILDEPAASLDVRAEARLYDTFHELTRGHTSIVISHRFATVRQAERVIVLEDGKVIEDGPHEALMAAGLRYAELFQLQARRFEESAP